MGWSPQSELGEIPLYERKTQMRGGRKQRDIRGSGRRTRSRSDDERWCGVHRLRSIHKALAGNAGETEPALDSQIYEVFLAEPFCARFAFLTVADCAEETGVCSHDNVRPHICVGG
jgi:hypothetical protein